MPAKSRRKKAEKVDKENKVTETFEDELKSIREKGSLLKGEEREFYGSVVQRLENNNQVLSDLRLEHHQLRVQLGEGVKKKKDLSETLTLEQDLRQTAHRVNVIKQQIDSLNSQKTVNDERQAELTRILDKFERGEEVNPDEEKIALIKHKMTNTRIKNTEAIRLGKQYEKLMTLLDKQKMFFKPELARQLVVNSQQQKDMVELEVIARESKYSKKQAKSAYEQAAKEVIAEKKKQHQELEKKKKEIQDVQNNLPQTKPGGSEVTMSESGGTSSLDATTSVVRSRQYKGQKEKKDEKLKQLETQLNQVEEFFETTDDQEIYKYFDERKRTSETLRKQIEDLDVAVKELEQQHSRVSSALEEKSYTASVGVGGNRMIKEGNDLLKRKKEDLALSERKYATTQELFKSIIVGIMHFNEVLTLVVTEPSPPKTAQEVLVYAKEKGRIMNEALQNGENVNYKDLVNEKVLIEMIQKSNEIERTATTPDTTTSKDKKAPAAVDLLITRPRQRDNKLEAPSRIATRKQVKDEAVKTAAETMIIFKKQQEALEKQSRAGKH